jgi:hypothetical protein
MISAFWHPFDGDKGSKKGKKYEIFFTFASAQIKIKRE